MSIIIKTEKLRKYTIGSIEHRILVCLKRYGAWTEGIHNEWVYRNPSTTLRILKRLHEKGYVTVEEEFGPGSKLEAVRYFLSAYGRKEVANE